MESRKKWKNRYYKEKAKNKDYISKDKIREKIKELKGNKDFDLDVYTEEFVIDILQELLEEN